MKRQVKLITSIIGVALSVFLLAVGVYASAERRVGISGSISFTSSALRFDYEIFKTDNNGYSSQTETVPYASTAFSQGTFNQQTLSEDYNRTAEIGKVNLNDEKNAFAYKVVLTSQEETKTLSVEIDVEALTEYSSWLTTIIKHNNVVHDSELTFQIAPKGMHTFEFIFVTNPSSAPSLLQGIDFGSSFTITPYQ